MNCNTPFFQNKGEIFLNIQTNLFDFAFVPAWLEQLDELADMTLPEPWSFVSPSKTGINTYTPILERYINTVFHKQALAYIFAQDLHVVGTGNALRGAVVCFYLSNEGVSLLENAAHLGLPIPEKLKTVLQQLHNRDDNTEDNTDDHKEDN